MNYYHNETVAYHQQTYAFNVSLSCDTRVSEWNGLYVRATQKRLYTDDTPHTKKKKRKLWLSHNLYWVLLELGVVLLILDFYYIVIACLAMFVLKC